MTHNQCHYGIEYPNDQKYNLKIAHVTPRQVFKLSTAVHDKVLGGATNWCMIRQAMNLQLHSSVHLPTSCLYPSTSGIS